MAVAELEQWLGDRSFEDWCAEFDEQGYVVFERVLDEIQLAEIRNALDPHLGENLLGRNEFEGTSTNRVYGLLAKSPVFADLAMHPLALAFAERDLGDSCLLSSCLAINLQPGETAQPWHHDDGTIPIPLPHPSWMVSTFWAISDTTETNGATEIIPYSHRWQADELAALGGQGIVDDTSIEHPDAMKVTMPAGSVLITKGTLFHRGGANNSDGDRLVITPQYCPGWARPIENMMVVVPPELAAPMPKRVRELLGYSIYPPFMGYADGRHPQKLLDAQTQA